MVLYFYLRRGEHPGCPLRLQRGVAPEGSQASPFILARSKQASKLQKQRLLLSLHSSWLWRNISQMLKFSFETLSPVDKNHLSYLICTLSLKIRVQT